MTTGVTLQMCGTVLEELLSEGWPVAAKQLDQFFCGMPPAHYFVELRKRLLDGPLVVQMTKARNVSHPKHGEKAVSDGLVKVQLGDGYATIQAILTEPIPLLNGETAPGTKCRLVGRIPLENGMLVVNRSNFEVLGGFVLPMVEKWKLEKSWHQKAIRSPGEDDAPKWIQFSNQKPSESMVPENDTVSMSQTDDITTAIAKIAVDEQGSECDTAEKIQIEPVAEANSAGKFASGQKVIFTAELQQVEPKFRASELNMKTVDNGPPIPYRRAAGEKTKFTAESSRNRYFGREDRRNLLEVHRPSNPPTLFDFVQTKISLADETKEHAHTSVKAPKMGPGERAFEQRGPRRHRGGANKGMAYGPREQQGFFNGPRVFESANGNRNRRQYGFRGGQRREIPMNDFEIIPEQDMQRYAYEYPPIGATSQEPVEFIPHAEPYDPAEFYTAPPSFPLPPPPPPQPDIVYYPRDYVVEDNPGMMPPQPPYYAVAEVPVWKIGDKCFAPWRNRAVRFYPATIVSMGPVDMCTVEYEYYGNQGTVPVGSLLPYDRFYANYAYH
ncbi:unnamed protein product [Gongylonema pulchrum]|uniref:Tudor domain-containing protein n=1 Tax=Gongylonema pulchrum TaxID=637853 RepID=A0A183DRZ8_9BILA|nr:unnamed protein product [Gongylonema pulchrum]